MKSEVRSADGVSRLYKSQSYHNKFDFGTVENSICRL